MGVNKKELISVIIPTYNRCQMLERAIKSVIAQDYVNLEIIIVDDDSKDNTEETVRSFKDSRISYFRQSVNKGAAAARNLGMQKAKGEYLAFLDSDDEFVPCRLTRIVGVFGSLEKKPEMIFTNALEINARGAKVLTVDKDYLSGYVTTGCRFPASIFTPTSCWMIHRDVAQGEFFDEKIYVIEDCDYFARIVRKSKSYFLNEALTLKHVHDSTESRVPIQYAEQTRDRMLEKWLPEMRKDKKYLVSFYCTMAKDLILCGKKKKARDVLLKAFCVDPFNMKPLGRFMKAGVLDLLWIRDREESRNA